MAARKISILQIMECTIGGTRRHIRELSMGLVRRGHAVTCVCSAVRDPTFLEDMDAMKRAGVRVVELPMLRRIAPLTDLRHLLFLAGHLRRHSYDVVHTHSSKAGILGRAAHLLMGKGPVVHTPHTFSFGFKGHFSAPKSRLFLFLERFFGRRSSRIINVSRSERNDALSFGITAPGRLVVVENGIDAEPYAGARPPDPAEGLFPDGDFQPRLGTVGLLNAAKAHDLLIRAFARLLDKFPRAGLAIVGEGALRGDLERLIRERKLEHRVFLVGYRQDVPGLLKELDLFVFPSHWEGMPYVLLEAMASGLPAVVSDVNGSRDMVVHGETGLIVPPGQEEPLAQACEELLADPERRARLGAAGAARVRSHYTLEKMVAGVEKVYLEILDEEVR